MSAPRFSLLIRLSASTTISLATVAALSASVSAPTGAIAQERPRSRGTCDGTGVTDRVAARCRADSVVAALGTVDNKLAAARNGFRAAGIPDPVPADGPAGLRFDGISTALPSPIAVAASFDPAVATLHGGVLGAEARAAGKTTVYGPAMDVLRTWRSGRVAESFGEDPLLAAAMATASVRAVQAHHVIATVKHFAAYTQEAGRLGDSPLGARPSVDQQVSQRTLREIYYPPFEAAVISGEAGGVMCAFPRLNGVYACENEDLLGTLKNEWHFDGAVVPDFPDAQRSVVAAANAGLDVGTFYPASPFPGAPAVTPGADVDLSTAVKAGRVTVSRLDDMLRRRLVPAFRLGVFPLPAGSAGVKDVSTPEHRRSAVTIAEAGAVLLKNANSILPLAKYRSIAVIGAQAGDRPVVAEEGSAHVEAEAAGLAWKAIAARAGAGVDTAFEPGMPPLGEGPAPPVSALHTADGRLGLEATYVNNPRRDFSVEAVARRVEPMVKLDAAPAIAGLAPNNGWSVRWSGTFTPAASGLQRFTLAGSGSGRLLIDGKQVADFQRADFGTIAYASLTLQASKPVAIAVEWTPREAAPLPRTELFGTTIGTSLRLGWTPVGDMIDRAAALAARSNVALVFVAKETGEGADQTSLSLPAEQDALIQAIAAANPRTVVALSAGGAVAMPWLDRVAAVLDLWYPGDAHAAASTALLFGDAAPGGRLPLTFPAHEGQGPGASLAGYPGIPAPDGGPGTVRFDEGLAVGYRFYLNHGQKPLFPFGFGLTYAPMALEAPRLIVAKRDVALSVLVRNGGRAADSAVVQAYITHPAESGEPSRLLAAFMKVKVAPRRSEDIVVALPQRAFQHWSEVERRWVSTPGDYVVELGTSSTDFVFKGTVHVDKVGLATVGGNR